VQQVIVLRLNVLGDFIAPFAWFLYQKIVYLQKTLTMKNRYNYFIYLSGTLFILLISSACSSSKTSTDAAGKATDNARGVYQSLADHLRRNPSVRIIGNGEDIQVVVRGMDTFGGNIEPLFVIDGSQVGNSYAQANRMVDVNDIRSVQVLNVTDATSAYGLRGSKGAVVIRTKTSNK